MRTTAAPIKTYERGGGESAFAKGQSRPPLSWVCKRSCQAEAHMALACGAGHDPSRLGLPKPVS